MAVALDAVTDLGGLGTAGDQTESVTLASGVKAVFFVGARSGSNTIGFSEVRWGSSSGTLFTRLGGGTYVFPSGETCSMEVWYSLNGDIPGSGAQNIWNNNTASSSYGMAVAYTAGADVAIGYDDADISSASVTDPSGSIALGGVSSAVFQALISGGQGVGDITPLSGWTGTERDMGAQQLAIYTYDTVGTSDVTYGWTQTSEDARAVAVAIYEDGGGGAVTGTLAATESGSDTAALSGVVLVSGALAATESGSDTAALAGNVLVSGSLAATESGADTAAFLGGGASPAITGTLAATESGSDTAAVSGKVYVAGQLSAVEGALDAFAASGNILVSGSLAAAETGSDTASFTSASSYFNQAQLDEILAYVEANLTIGDEVIEGTITLAQALRILLAFAGGKRVGLNTATEQYMAQDGVTPRITFSPTNANGDGTPVLDGS